MGAGHGVAGAALGAEVCAPLLLLCWLCCWPEDTSSDTSSNGKHPRKPVIAYGDEAGGGAGASRRRRSATSAVSLHLPGTSGQSKEQLSAHRSHEELPRRRRSAHAHPPAPAPRGHEQRYHSAPSVIHEVLHRRDWDRSTRELYIPLKPDTVVPATDADSDASPEPPLADPESSSIGQSDDRLHLPCKKHYTNIKSSRSRTTKEASRVDVKDTDESANFYIGETQLDSYISKQIPSEIDNRVKSVYRAKDEKQSFNESIKVRGPGLPEVSVDRKKCWREVEGDHSRMFLAMELMVDELDRSGAMHAGDGLELRFPPASVEAVDYAGGACYLAESGTLTSLRAGGALAAARGGGGGRGGRGEGALRARHASDGEILAPPPQCRPESGAFSESDLDVECDSGDERPPPYRSLQPDRKETAI